MIFWSYHFFDVNLSSNCEIRTQERKDGGLPTAERGSGSRNQWPASPCQPPSALPNHSYLTLSCLSVHLSLYLRARLVPAECFKEPRPHLSYSTIPRTPNSELASSQRHTQAWFHNSTLLFLRLPQSSLLLLRAESTTKSHHWVLSPTSLLHVYSLKVQVGAFRGVRSFS